MSVDRRGRAPLAALILCLAWLAAAHALEPLAPLQGPFVLDRIVDGDTIRVFVDGRSESVRLIGIDTPETKAPGRPVQPFGPEASEQIGRLLASEEVWLEFDVRPRDRYERLLAYVYYRSPDGTWRWDGERYDQANLEMALSGYADILTVPPDVRYVELYQYAVRTAREAERGMWGVALRADPAVGGGERSAAAAAATVGAAVAATNEPEAAGAIRVGCVLYNPAGVDDGNETVTLQVLEDVDATGWRIEDAVGHVLPLPAGRFAVGEVLVVRNPGDPIWNNRDGDTVLLFDAQGVQVDMFRYAGGGIEACR